MSTRKLFLKRIKIWFFIAILNLINHGKCCNFNNYHCCDLAFVWGQTETIKSFANPPLTFENLKIHLKRKHCIDDYKRLDEEQRRNLVLIKKIYIKRDPLLQRFGEHFVLKVC